MESIFEFLQFHPQWVYLLLPFLFLGSGCFIPISEELLILFCGYLASYMGNPVLLFCIVYMSVFLCGDCVPYVLGRILVPRIYRLQKIFHNKAEFLQFFKKNQKRALFMGRFIPFGVRNCLFLYSGFHKMAFKKFALIDGLAALLFSAVWFIPMYYLPMYWARSAERLQDALKIGFFLALGVLTFFMLYKKWVLKKNKV